MNENETKKKEFLKNKLIALMQEQISDTEFVYKGNCGNEHRVISVPCDDIMPKTLIKRYCRDCGEMKCDINDPIMYVGMGNGCDEQANEIIPWFVCESKEGLVFIQLENLKECLIKGTLEIVEE